MPKGGKGGQSKSALLSTFGSFHSVPHAAALQGLERVREMKPKACRRLMRRKGVRGMDKRALSFKGRDCTILIQISYEYKWTRRESSLLGKSVLCTCTMAVQNRQTFSETAQ